MAAAAAVALWFAVDPSERSAPSVLGELSKERAESGPAAVPAREPAASPALAEKDSPSDSRHFGGVQRALHGRAGQRSTAGRRCRRRETAGVVQREESGVGEIRSGSDRGREVSSDQPLGCPRCGPGASHRQRQRPRRWIVFRRREGMRAAPGRRTPTRRRVTRRRAIKPRTVRRRKRTRLRARRRRDSRHSRSASWSPTRQDSRVAARRDAAAPAESASFRRVAAVLEIRTPDSGRSLARRRWPSRATVARRWSDLGRSVPCRRGRDSDGRRGAVDDRVLARRPCRRHRSHDRWTRLAACAVSRTPGLHGRRRR